MEMRYLFRDEADVEVEFLLSKQMNNKFYCDCGMNG